MAFARSARSTLAALLTALLAQTALLPAPALAQQVATAERREALEVSRSVWSTALAGNKSPADADKVLDPLRAIPADSVNPGLARLHSLVESYDANKSKQQTSRAERITALQKELDEALAKPESPTALSAALKPAVELTMVVPDKSQILNDPRIVKLVESADRAARDAEAAADWLTANELFWRLNLLLEEDGRYKKDVTRLGHRLTMLRIFVPQRLWDLRDAQRRADGKDPLPPFNALGEDFRDKLRGVSSSMVEVAIDRAAREHVDRSRISRKDLLLGGLDFVRTMVTTQDLKSVFPNIADEHARQRMLDYIDERERAVLARPDKLSGYDVRDAIKDLLRVNAESTAIPEPALLREFGDGAMAKLDEFSAIIWPDDLARFERTYQGKLKGVGVQIQMDEASQMIKVVTPLEGTPAQRAGVRSGDLIKKIGGQSAIGLSLNQAVELITGPPGTHVSVTMERDGNEVEFDLVRAVIPLRSVKGWKRLGAKEDHWDWFIDPESKIGYVRLTGFQEETTKELAAAVDQMKATGLNGLILDLRFNPGGLLTQAVSVANFFIENGTIVSTTGDGIPERAIARNARLKDIPVAVLINEGSASASEIVAGAIRDRADKGDIHAILVGDRTYGKGSVQNVFEIAANAQMKLTTQYYKLPGGQIIHRLLGAKEWGVEPHVTCFMLPDQISDALTLRQDADVVQIDQNGQVMAAATPPPDPSKLITDGIDLQLQYALILLQTQTLPPTADEQARAN